MSVIPQNVIDDWYSQYVKGADLWAQYPEIDREEVLRRVNLDFGMVREVASRDVTAPVGRKPVYLAPAGAPLAGKSTILDQERDANPERYGNMVRIDPDRHGMLFMTWTYHDYLLSAGMVANAESYEVAQQRAYNVARPASNYLTLELLNESVERRFDIVHSTTMTNEHIGKLLGSLKEQGYEIDLLLCSAEDQMRADAQEYRSNTQGYYQSTPEDVLSKGLVFPQRMKEYFELGDNLSVFWRNGVTEDAVKAAVYTNGQKEVLDQNAYDSFVNKYNADRHALAHPSEGDPIILPAFEDIEQAYVQRFVGKATLKSNFDPGQPQV